jgi:hypothetical protein
MLLSQMLLSQMLLNLGDRGTPSQATVGLCEATVGSRQATMGPSEATVGRLLVRCVALAS